MADTYIHKPFAISKTLKMVTRSESSFLISSWSYSDKTLEDWLIYPMPQHDAPSSFATLSQIWCLATDLWNFFMPRFFRDFHQTSFSYQDSHWLSPWHLPFVLVVVSFQFFFCLQCNFSAKTGAGLEIHPPWLSVSFCLLLSSSKDSAWKVWSDPAPGTSPPPIHTLPPAPPGAGPGRGPWESFKPFLSSSSPPVTLSFARFEAQHTWQHSCISPQQLIPDLKECQN